jgi:uncharacterized iron-regulated membrane protein
MHKAVPLEEMEAFGYLKEIILKKRVKRTFAIHHWIGLLAGIFLLVASITGSILVFHHEIDHVQFSAKAALKKPAAELIMDNSFEHISQQYPGHDIRVPDFPEVPSQAIKYEIRKGGTRTWVFAHPETGEFLGTVNRADQRFVHILLNLHYNLLSGTAGKVIVLLGGIALIILSTTGFLLYRKSILKVITFRQKISFTHKRSLFSSLHRIVGVWSLVFNLLISISGTWIAYTIVESAFAAAGNTVQEAPISTPSLAYRSVDSSLRQIKSDYPDFEIKYLHLANGKLSVSGRLATDPLVYGRTVSNIAVDMHSGKIGQANFLRDAPWHKKALAILKPLHFGDFAGLGIKLIYSFFGLLPGVLAVSGFFIWRHGRLIKPQSRNKGLSKSILHKSMAYYERLDQ